MDYLKSLYIIAIVHIAAQFLLMGQGLAPLRLTITLIIIVITTILFYEDAKLRKLSGIHALWSLVFPIGLPIYHFLFAKNKPIVK